MRFVITESYINSRKCRVLAQPRRANHRLSCPAPFAKIFRFRPDPNQIHNSRRLVPHEGRIAIVTDAGRDAVDAAASGDARGWQGGSTRPVSEGMARWRTMLAA